MKILVVTKNWLGDLLFQFPAIEAIKRQWPHAEIVCVTPARCVPLLRAHPDVNRVLVFDERREHRSLPAKISFLWKLRKEKWDRAYLFHRSRTRAALIWLSGAENRLGFGTDRRMFLTQALPEPEAALHHVDYFLELLERTGHDTPKERQYRFYFSGKDDEQARELLSHLALRKGGYACFHLGANWEPKRWPPGHFARLADMLEAKWSLPVIVTGAPGDQSLSKDMLRRVRKARVTSLTGKTTLGVLGALFQNSAFVVSGDSGPMHIASGTGTCVAALFGPTDPRRTGPRGIGQSVILQYIPQGYKIPWHGTQLPKEGWLSKIQPEEVLEKIEKAGWLKAADLRGGAR